MESPNLNSLLTHNRHTLVRFAAVLLSCALTAFATPLAPKEATAEFHQNIEPLLVEYCYDCHGDGFNKGGVAFDKIASGDKLLANPKVWLMALKNVRAGLMPPDDGPRPSAEEVERLTKWIKFGAFGLDPANPDPGHITVRRLNRAEYSNTIRDLVGVEFMAEAWFPPDDSGGGFDNIGDILSVSPLLLEKYLQAADTIVGKAVPKVSRVVENRVAQGKDFKRTDGSGEGRLLSAFKPATSAYTFSVEHPENYRVVFDLNISGSFDFSPGHCRLIGRIDGKEVLQEDIVWYERKPLHYEFEQQWTAGNHEVTFEVQPLELIATPSDGEATPAPKPAVSPTPAAPVTQVAAAEAVPEEIKLGSAVKNFRAKKRQPRSLTDAPYVNVRLETVRVEGPLNERHWVKPDNYTRFFTRDAAPDAPEERLAYARDVMRQFATRAFRRPVEDAKVEQLADMARGMYEQPGKTFEQGIARAMLAVLASPRFLFLIEEPSQEKGHDAFVEIDEYALASRLSYFLWSSMPDQELFNLAQRGELRRQLPAQVNRMLADSRSQSLVKNFVGQWLQARDVESVPINAREVLELTDIPRNVSGPVDFNGTIRKAMRRETEMYFEHVMKKDRSVLEFIDSDYTFLNEILATYYDIPGVTGTELREVKVSPESMRGGILTQGTVLAVTSNPTRTSPVKRGVFILDNFLGTPPPPPPPDIPALEDAKKEIAGHEPSLREMLSLHRADPMCSSCHTRMDPLGLAMENFNAMGMWRFEESKQPIASEGQLATGEKFKDVRELKRILSQDRQLDFYRCLTEKLLTYALGRGLEYYDVQTVDQIVDNLVKEKGRFSALLSGVINSTPFQKLRNESVLAADTTKTASSP